MDFGWHWKTLPVLLTVAEQFQLHKKGFAATKRKTFGKLWRREARFAPRSCHPDNESTHPFWLSGQSMCQLRTSNPTHLHLGERALRPALPSFHSFTNNFQSMIRWALRMSTVTGSSFGARGNVSRFKPASCGSRLPFFAFTAL